LALPPAGAGRIRLMSWFVCIVQFGIYLYAFSWSS